MRSTLFTRAMPVMALPSAARVNGAATGATIDLGMLGNNFRAVWFIITTAVITDGSHAVTVEHSLDGTTWTAVPANRRQGSLPTIGGPDDNVLFDLGYIVGQERFVRLVATTSGATTGGVFSAVAVLSSASSSPVVRS